TMDAAPDRASALTRDQVIASRAAIEAKLGKSEQALATYKRLSDPSRYSYRMGLLAERLGHIEEARALLEATITSGTNQSEIEAARGRLAGETYRKNLDPRPRLRPPHPRPREQLDRRCGHDLPRDPRPEGAILGGRDRDPRKALGSRCALGESLLRSPASVRGPGPTRRPARADPARGRASAREVRHRRPLPEGVRGRVSRGRREDPHAHRVRHGPARAAPDRSDPLAPRVRGQT